MPATLSWEEKIKIAKKSGYDFLEISIDETDEKLERLNWTKTERLDLLRLLYKHDFRIDTMCLSGHRRFPLGSHDPKTQETSLEIMEKAIDLAVDLGIRVIQLAGYDVYYEESNEDTKKNFAENLKVAVDMAAKKGVVLGFETMETNFMDTIEKAMKYVNLINSPYLKIYPDIGNLKNAAVLYEHDVIDDLHKGTGNIVASHLKETKPGIYRELMFGEGHVDFDKLIGELWSLGVRKYVAEFWYVGNENWQDDLVYANQFLREKFKQYSK